MATEDEKLNNKASWIITGCIFTLFIGCLIVLGERFLLSRNRVETIHYIIQADSTGHLCPEAKAQVDSLIRAFDMRERRIADKYEYIIEQRANLEDYMTIGGVLLSIVLAVFGFFGFKSLHGIEERLKDQIEPKLEGSAKDKAEEVSRNLFDHYRQQADSQLEHDRENTEARFNIYKESTSTAVDRRITESVGMAMARHRKGQREDIEVRIQEAYNKFFSEKTQAIKDNTANINSIQAEVTGLRARLDEMKAGRPSAAPSQDPPTPPLSRDNEDPDPYKLRA